MRRRNDSFNLTIPNKNYTGSYTDPVGKEAVSQAVVDILSQGPSVKAAIFSFEPKDGNSLYKTENPPFSVPVAIERIQKSKKSVL